MCIRARLGDGRVMKKCQPNDNVLCRYGFNICVDLGHYYCNLIRFTKTNTYVLIVNYSKIFYFLAP